MSTRIPWKPANGTDLMLFTSHCDLCRSQETCGVMARFIATCAQPPEWTAEDIYGRRTQCAAFVDDDAPDPEPVNPRQGSLI